MSGIRRPSPVPGCWRDPAAGRGEHLDVQLRAAAHADDLPRRILNYPRDVLDSVTGRGAPAHVDHQPVKAGMLPCPHPPYNGADHRSRLLGLAARWVAHDDARDVAAGAAGADAIAGDVSPRE